MTEIVNLRQARKAKARSDKETQAAENRAAFGQTKAEKHITAAETARRDGELDGAKRER